MSIAVTSGLAILLYLLAAARLCLPLLRATPASAAVKWQGLLLGGAALIVHGAVLYQTMNTDAGLNLGFFHALSLVAWVIVLFVSIGALTRPLENLAIFLFPLAALAVLLQINLPSQHVLPESTPPGLRAHIVLSICSYSLLAVAALQAIVLALQENRLRHKHPGVILQMLPPLQTMENVLFQLITIGFFMLSISLATGLMFVHDLFAQHLAHKTILSILAWTLFAVLLWGRWSRGWRGRIAVGWTLSAFAVLMLAYFGSKVVLELILQRV
jgi:ABC-type uncharacterized transport system permease subunit